jgi:hypothetical protein
MSRLLAPLILLLAAIWTAGAATAADRHAGYRLAGIVAAGETRIGFVEVPEGGQVLVRLGSVVNGGEVVAFGQDSLRIRFADETIELSLESSGRPQTVVSAREIIVDDYEQGHVIRRTVDAGRLNEALDSPADGSATPRKAGGGPAPSAQRSVTQRFAPLVNLPLNSTVVQVNERPVRSADDAIETVESSLAGGTPARLTLDGPSGMKRVYLIPAQPDAPASPPRP